MLIKMPSTSVDMPKCYQKKLISEMFSALHFEVTHFPDLSPVSYRHFHLLVQISISRWFFYQWKSIIADFIRVLSPHSIKFSLACIKLYSLHPAVYMFCIYFLAPREMLRYFFFLGAKSFKVCRYSATVSPPVCIARKFQLVFIGTLTFQR